MNLRELNEAIIKWAGDRLILEHSTAYDQAFKTAEEVFELITAEAKYELVRGYTATEPADEALEEIKDAIGDIWVTLVVGASCYASEVGADYQPWVTATPSSVKKPTEALQKSLIPLGASSKGQGSYWMTHNLMVSYLAQIVDSLDVTLTECVEQAYNEIKDRKGFLNAQGIFVKEQA